LHENFENISRLLFEFNFLLSVTKKINVKKIEFLCQKGELQFSLQSPPFLKVSQGEFLLFGEDNFKRFWLSKKKFEGEQFSVKLIILKKCFSRQLNCLTEASNLLV